MKIERLMLDGLEHYDSRLKGWMGDRLANAGAFRNWRHTEKAGAVTCWPVGQTPLEASVAFLFTETPPSNGQPKAPDNPSTITGVSSVTVTRCGKNLLSYSTSTVTQNYVTCTNNGDGTYTLNGTASADCSFNLTPNLLYLPAGTYKMSGCPAGGSSSTYFLGSGGGYRNYGNEVEPSLIEHDGGYRWFWIGVVSGADVSNVVFRPQVELGSTATSFESYAGTDYTLPLGNTYYGGTVDLSTGVMTVTHKFYQITSSLDTSWNSSVNCLVVHYMQESIGASILNGVCTHFPNIGHVWDSNTPHYYQGAETAYFFNSAWLSKQDGLDFLDAQEQAGTPVQIVYTLKTPTTVQLTPIEILSLAQTDKYTPRLNTVYTDALSVQVGYRKSPIRDYYEKTQAIIAQGGEV